MTDTEASVQRALTQVGVQYVYGDESPGVGMDCSGLVQWAYKPDFPNMPRTTFQQVLAGKKVTTKQRGDLVFPYADHVTICLGGGQLLEAPQPGQKVHIIADYIPNPMAIIRMGDNGGLPGSATSGLGGNSDGGNGGANAQDASALSDITGLFGTLGDSFEFVNNIFHVMTQSNFWIRVIKLAAGGIMLSVGTFLFLDYISGGSDTFNNATLKKSTSFLKTSTKTVTNGATNG